MTPPEMSGELAVSPAISNARELHIYTVLCDILKRDRVSR